MKEKFSVAMISVDIGNIIRKDKIRRLTIFTNTIHELFILRDELIKHQCIDSIKIPIITYDPRLIYSGILGPLKRFRLLFSELDIKKLTEDTKNKLFNYYYGRTNSYSNRYFIFMDIKYTYDNIEEVSNVLYKVLTDNKFKLVRRDNFSELLDNEKLLKLFKNGKEKV